MRILAIDGGGIRGLIPALVLARLERETGKRVVDLFDMVAGTSTGGILACSLVVPDEDGRPRHTAEDVADLYRTEGPRIFERSLWQITTSAGGLADQKHDSYALDRALRRYVGGAQLSQALVNVLVTAYDLEAGEPYFFKSWRPDRDAPMVEVARATASAPTYFEPLLVEGPPRQSLIDGGVFATNPAMCAYAEAARIRPGAPVRMLSLGTGRLPRRIEHEAAQSWGLLEWARPVIDVVFDGVADTVEYQLAHLVEEQDRLRLQIDLPRNIGLDDASPRALRELEALAEELLARDGDRLLAFAATL